MARFIDLASAGSGSDSDSEVVELKRAPSAAAAAADVADREIPPSEAGKRKNTFRFGGVKVGLTCSKWRRTKMPKDEFKAWVLRSYIHGQPWGEVTEWMFSQELHEDGTVHWHGFMMWASKFQTREARAFDRDAPDAMNSHCNVKKIQAKNGWVKYISKDGDFVGNINKPEEKITLKDLKKKIEEGWTVSRLLLSDDWCNHAGRHLKVLREMEAVIRGELKTEVKEESVDEKRLKRMIDYVSVPNPDARTILWWHADPGAGKTTTLSAFANWCRENKRPFYKCGADENPSRAACKWRGEPIVVFDLPKNCTDKAVPYAFMEGVLDGEFQIAFGIDSRLERCVHEGRVVRGWVIVCANVDPNRLSLDKTYDLL